MKFAVTREVLNLGLKIIVITIDGVNINKETKKFLDFKEKLITPYIKNIKTLI